MRGKLLRAGYMSGGQATHAALFSAGTTGIFLGGRIGGDDAKSDRSVDAAATGAPTWISRAPLLTSAPWMLTRINPWEADPLKPTVPAPSTIMLLHSNSTEVTDELPLAFTTMAAPSVASNWSPVTWTSLSGP